MPTWFVLLVMDAEKEHEVYNSLCRSDKVKEVHPLFGEWDILVKLEGEKNFLIETIKNELKIDGVLATKTLVGL